ncbi:MAG: competence/damage-inducible protein A [Gammaproteobacteria bacterium]|nr:competence/damage-inducible protein A [Gammaproteobacteria bacterium]
MPQPDPISACLIIIGNEILSGRTQDANLAIIGKKCDALGIRLTEARVIADTETAIIDTVNTCRAQFTYVFTTGGIGPTHDDITAAAVARAFEVELLRNEAARKALDRYYEPKRLTEARLKMADIPAGARLIDNPVSGAPGFQLQNVFVLPGVPAIMEAMFAGLTDRLVGGDPIITDNVTTNLPESEIAADLSALQAHYPDISMGSYPYFRKGKLGVNLVLRGTDAARMKAAAAALMTAILRLGGEALHGSPT